MPYVSTHKNILARASPKLAPTQAQSQTSTKQDLVRERSFKKDRQREGRRYTDRKRERERGHIHTPAYAHTHTPRGERTRVGVFGGR